MVTVTGKILDATGTPISPPPRVSFRLTNFGTDQPRIASTGEVYAAFPITVTCAADGTFSILLYGNDAITPQGTYYSVTIIAEGGQYTENYSFSGAAVDLSTAVPVGAQPPVPPVAPSVQVAVAPLSPGNFTVAHGLGRTPLGAFVMMTSPGSIWFQSPTLFDNTNLYLVASDSGVTAKVEVW